jgi:aspartate/methionine/tyrosine aminotransferase
VYRELVYDTAASREFAITDDNIVRIGSLSKSLSIPGLRLGYICGSKTMIDNADLFNQHIQTCINSLSCYLIENLNADLFHSFARKCAGIYKERFDVISQSFRSTELRLLHSDASFYSLVDFGKYFRNGQEACDFLSSKLNINAVPGRPYGDNFESYIRICLTLPAEALSKIFEQIVNNLPDAHI